VQNPKARSELSKSFRLRRDSVAAEIGEATLHQEMQRYGLPRELLAEKGMDEVADSFAVPDKARFFANIGKGLIRLPEAIERIRNLLFNGNVFLVPPPAPSIRSGLIPLIRSLLNYPVAAIPTRLKKAIALS
jgi:guanosine-3',5'-bis(diphosphate) 3'-pyrophosphohydrolase